MGVIDFVSGGGRTNVDKFQFSNKNLDPNRQQQQDSRGYQEYLQGKYKDQIEGRGPSVAEQQMIGQNEAAKRQQLAMARSGGGGALGQASAMRGAQQSAAMQDAQLARSSGLLRANEQQAAMNAAGGLASQTRAQDQGMFNAEANFLATQANSFNQQQAAQAQADESYKTRRGSGAGGIISAGAAMGGALLSDKRAKDDQGPAPSSDLEAFLEAAAGHRYKYRSGMGEDPGREHFGPMAQDLEQSAVGQSLVNEGPDGLKRIDTEGATGAMLAAMHEINARLRALEGSKGKK